MLYSGVDLHRRLIVICTVDKQGAIVARSRMKNDPVLVSEYFRRWSDQHRAVVECTTGWYWFSDLLRSLGIDLVLAHAKYLKAISYAKVKTDAIDAHTLAQLLRLGYVPEAYQLPAQHRALRDLLRQRMVIAHKRTNIIQRITSILAQFNITELSLSPSQTGFADFLNGCGIPEEYRITLMLYHQQCLQATEHCRQLEKHFKSVLRPLPEVQHLLSIPGIGSITGSLIAMETGDIHRFADAKHYCSYCRLVPGAINSGGRRAHRSGSKDGNRYLKFAFTESAVKAIQFYPEIKRFAANLQRRSGSAIARTVVAKELAKISYYVLSNQQDFRTFKGISIIKLRNWPCAHKPVRLTGGNSSPSV